MTYFMNTLKASKNKSSIKIGVYVVFFFENVPNNMNSLTAIHFTEFEYDR